jgi:hypothetical protein
LKKGGGGDDFPVFFLTESGDFIMSEWGGLIHAACSFPKKEKSGKMLVRDGGRGREKEKKGKSLSGACASEGGQLPNERTGTIDSGNTYVL